MSSKLLRSLQHLHSVPSVGFFRILNSMVLFKMPVEFVFDEKKAAQAAACLLKLNKGKMNYMVLIKLLYLADRQALTETEMPITGDHMVCMPHGPVLSSILDLINMGDPDTNSAWFKHVSEPSDFVVSINEDSECEELSEYELDVLKNIYKKFGKMDKWRLRDLTHTLPEWKDPEGSSIPIDPEVILESVGKSAADISRIKSEARELTFFENLKRP